MRRAASKRRSPLSRRIDRTRVPGRDPGTRGYGTLAAIAAVAFIVACVSHEAVGHGGMCLAVGGRIALLTSVYFHCANGGPITHAAGARPETPLRVGGRGFPPRPPAPW